MLQSFVFYSKKSCQMYMILFESFVAWNWQIAKQASARIMTDLPFNRQMQKNNGL